MVDKTIFIFIQARVSSKRFPDKILKKIGSKIVLDLLFQRLNKIRFKKKIVFLIPKNLKNKKLKKFLLKRKLNYFEGSEKNVLKRFFLAAKFFNAKHIMRITADCPLVDFKLLNSLIKKYLTSNFDYVSNVYPKRSFPDGLDAEIFNYKSLLYAVKNVKSSYDKEHVTTYIQRVKKLKYFNLTNKIDFKKIRITLDYKKDLKNLNIIFEKLNFDTYASLTKIIKVFKKNPDLFK